jgi:hypothetical protein
MKFMNPQTVPMILLGKTSLTIDKRIGIVPPDEKPTRGKAITFVHSAVHATMPKQVKQ